MIRILRCRIQDFQPLIFHQVLMFTLGILVVKQHACVCELIFIISSVPFMRIVPILGLSLLSKNSPKKRF